MSTHHTTSLLSRFECEYFDLYLYGGYSQIHLHTILLLSFALRLFAAMLFVLFVYSPALSTHTSKTQLFWYIKYIHIHIHTHTPAHIFIHSTTLSNNIISTNTFLNFFAYWNWKQYQKRFSINLPFVRITAHVWSFYLLFVALLLFFFGCIHSSLCYFFFCFMSL